MVAALLFFFSPSSTTSVCGPCTTTISSLSTATLSPSSGNVICITATGDFRGVIRRNSSSGTGTVTICNEGKISGATLEFNRGVNVIQNYGTMNPSVFQFNSSTTSNTITNYEGASATFSTFSLYQDNTLFKNYGAFTSGSFSLSSGADFTNHSGGTVSTERVEVNSNCVLWNEGTWSASGSFQVNSNASATSLTKLSVTGFLENNNYFKSEGELSMGGNLNMNSNSTTSLSGTVTVGGNVEANKTFTQSGTMQVSGNMNVNSDARLTVSGLITVGQNLTSNGYIDGPAVASGNWGRVNVAGVSTQNGNGRMRYNLDVCDAGNPPSGLDYNYGTKQSTVTHCINTPVGLLPVEWGEVSAKESPEGVTISWTTFKELNNNYFTLERSTDARGFEPVADIASLGNSDTPRQYEVSDARPPAGRLYYRIRQTDYDGQHDWSSVVETSWSAPAFDISFYPNPVSDKGTLKVLADQQGDAVLRILDQTGREISRQEAELLPGENLFNFETASWARGVYMVEVKRSAAGSSPAVFKIVKQ